MIISEPNISTPLAKSNGTFFSIEHLMSLKLFDFHQIYWVIFTGVYEPVCYFFTQIGLILVRQ